jgi:hypothetical protein
LGAKAVADTAHMTAHADAVVVCVLANEQVQQVCLNNNLLKAMASGSAVVHTTGNLAPSRPSLRMPRGMMSTWLMPRSAEARTIRRPVH